MDWAVGQNAKREEICQNNNNNYEKHLFSVCMVGGIDKPYLPSFFHNYTIS